MGKHTKLSPEQRVGDALSALEHALRNAWIEMKTLVEQRYHTQNDWEYLDKRVAENLEIIARLTGRVHIAVIESQQ